MTVVIQPDYWVGDKCLENEVPWITPEAVHYVNGLCKPDDVVLDIGSGGSTLFYARRCKHVVAIETDEKWYLQVQAKLKAEKIANVTHLLFTTQNEIEQYLLTHTRFKIAHDLLAGFTLASVDSVYGYYRSAMLHIILKNCDYLRTLVLDNYAADCLFHDHHNWTMKQIITVCPGTGWQGKDFDDSHWIGKGTRVVHK